MQWEFHVGLVQILIKGSQQIVAHATTAVLSCDVQKFVVIWWLEVESPEN